MGEIETSVVIPTHNREDLLQDMLRSFSAQTYPKERYEVIVVVDGSTDGTVDMLKKMHVAFDLRVLVQAQAGAAAARNNGAQWANGKVVVFLDDDLLPEPALLEEHARLHREDPQAVVLGRFLPYRHGRKKGWHVWEEQVFENHYRAMQDGRRPPAGRRLYSGNFSIGTAHFLEAGGFDMRLPRGEDVELGFRLEKAGMRFSFNPRAAAMHRGYRSFASWTNSAYLYGRTDVQLATQRGQHHALAEIGEWYSAQPGFTRWTLERCLGRTGPRHAAIEAFKALAGALGGLRANKLAHYGYSGIYRLQYWQGVADELGGRAEFYDLFLRPGDQQIAAATAAAEQETRG